MNQKVIFSLIFLVLCTSCHKKYNVSLKLLNDKVYINDEISNLIEGKEENRTINKLEFELTNNTNNNYILFCGCNEFVYTSTKKPLSVLNNKSSSNLHVTIFNKNDVISVGTIFLYFDPSVTNLINIDSIFTREFNYFKKNLPSRYKNMDFNWSFNSYNYLKNLILLNSNETKKIYCNFEMPFYDQKNLTPYDIQIYSKSEYFLEFYIINKKNEYMKYIPENYKYDLIKKGYVFFDGVLKSNRVVFKKKS